MKNLTAKQTETGWYVSAVSKGVRYGQGYPPMELNEALAKFRRLVFTYETKGAEYVARYGALA
jgi:hypothetical protein